MSSFYDLSDWDKVRIALLKQERDRLWKQIMNIEQEIHGIYEKAPMKYKLDFNIHEEKMDFDTIRASLCYGGDGLQPLGVVKIVSEND